jgi:hypothetical protein
MPKHSAPSSYSVLCRIARSKKKVLSATLRYDTYCEIQGKNFLADSVLCGTVGSRDSALCRIAQSRFSLSNRIIFLREFYMQNRFNPWIRGPRGTVWWKKNLRIKISWDCPFKMVNVTYTFFNCSFNSTINGRILGLIKCWPLLPNATLIRVKEHQRRVRMSHKK